MLAALSEGDVAIYVDLPVGIETENQLVTRDDEVLKRLAHQKLKLAARLEAFAALGSHLPSMVAEGTRIADTKALVVAHQPQVKSEATGPAAS